MRSFPTITPLQAKKLAGKSWTVDGHEYRFGAEAHLGKEALVYPLLDVSGEVVTYLRLPTALGLSAERIHRTEWLVAARLDRRSRAFEAAPRAWATTLHSGRVTGVGRDFAGTLHSAVPGRSWRQVKLASEEDGAPLPSFETRQRLVRDLLFLLADLEELGFVHGDLSHGNVVVDAEGGRCGLVDFDAFVFRGDPRLRYPSLPLSAGGVKGTPGYMPPELEASDSLEAAPFSDRFARDMLLIELLAFTPGCPVERSPSDWGDWQTVREQLRPVVSSLSLEHLLRDDLFGMPENERPSSQSLAKRLGWKPVAERPAPPTGLAEQVGAWASGSWGAAAAAAVVCVGVYFFASLLLRGSELTWVVLAAMSVGAVMLLKDDASTLWRQWEGAGFSLQWLMDWLGAGRGR